MIFLPRLKCSRLQLLNAVQKLMLLFIRFADGNAVAKEIGHGSSAPGGGPTTTQLSGATDHKKLLDFQTSQGPR
jgi:hypothetical protein